MVQFHIREYTASDVEGILALFRSSFQKEASEEWFRWKYQHSPFGSKGYVTIIGDLIVAFYGGIKLQFIFDSKRLWAYQFCDVMTHTEYRGRIVSKTPIVVKLGEMFYRDNPMDFAFGFPSLRHARLQSLRLGGEGYRLIRMYTKEDLKSYSVLWRLKVKEGWEFFKKDDHPEFTPLSKWGKGGVSGNDTLQIVKNEKYISWRYRENPSKKSNLLVFKRMNRTKGYIIFSGEDEWLNILEFFYKDDKDIQDILIALEAYVVENMTSIKGIRFWLHPMEPQTNDVETLGYRGTDSIPIAFRLVNRACGITSEIFYDRYFYRMGDYDAS